MLEIKMKRLNLVASMVVLALAAPAFAQFSIPWYTIDGGGGTSIGGSFTLSGTIGQPDAGSMAGGTFTLAGGFWAGVSAPGCVADFDDGSGTGTRDGGVTVEDLLYYLVLFGAGDARADVDDGSSTGTHDGGVTLEDLLFFLLHFQAGC